MKNTGPYFSRVNNFYWVIFFDNRINITVTALAQRLTKLPSTEHI
jgi:hypothetical protein